MFSFKHIVWRFENIGKVHYFQALLRIISLKSYNPTAESSQDLKEGKMRSWTRFKVALTLFYFQTHKPESPTDKYIYESSSKEHMSRKFQIWWSHSTCGIRSLLDRKFEPDARVEAFNVSLCDHLQESLQPSRSLLLYSIY